MKCPKCGNKMRRTKLHDITRYNESERRILFVCIKCGFDREYRGGGKNR